MFANLIVQTEQTPPAAKQTSHLERMEYYLYPPRKGVHASGALVMLSYSSSALHTLCSVGNEQWKYAVL